MMENEIRTRDPLFPKVMAQNDQRLSGIASGANPISNHGDTLGSDSKRGAMP
jgi:hypothetical protein